MKNYADELFEGYNTAIWKLPNHVLSSNVEKVAKLTNSAEIVSDVSVELKTKYWHVWSPEMLSHLLDMKAYIILKGLTSCTFKAEIIGTIFGRLLLLAVVQWNLMKVE